MGTLTQRTFLWCSGFILFRLYRVDQEVMTGIWYRYQRQVLMISEFDLMWSRYKQT